MHALISGKQVLEQNMHARCGFFVFVRQCEEVAEAFPMPFSFLGFQKREEASAILKWPKSFGRNWLLDVVKNGWRYTLRRYLYTVSRIVCRAHLAFQTCNGWCNAIRRQTEGQLCSNLQADLVFGNRQRWSYPNDIILLVSDDETARSLLSDALFEKGSTIS